MHYIPWKKEFTTALLAINKIAIASPPRDFAGSSFRPLSKIPHCCLLYEGWAFFSPNVADDPPRPAKDHGLGCLLNNQLPNLIQTLSYIDIVFRQTNCPNKLVRLIHHLSSMQIIFLYITHSDATYIFVRLACVKHIASIHSEPGSNSYNLYLQYPWS